MSLLGAIRFFYDGQTRIYAVVVEDYDAARGWADGVAGGSFSGAFGANCALSIPDIDSLRPLSSTPKARNAAQALE